MIDKGVAIWVPYRVWDPANLVFLDEDPGNHTLQIIKDGVMSAADNTPIKLTTALFAVQLTAAEVNGLFTTLHGVTSTADCYLLPVHMITSAPTKGQGMTVQFLAWDTLANAPKTGDVANFSMVVAQANSAAAAVNSPSEIGAAVPGLHSLVLDETETAGVIDSIIGTSTTSGAIIMSTDFATALNAATPSRYPIPSGPIDFSKITKAVEDILYEELEGYTIVRNAKRNEDANAAAKGKGWIGVYRASKRKTPHTLGSNNPYKYEVSIDIECQVAHMRSGNKAEDRLQAAEQEIEEALATDRTLKSTVLTTLDSSSEYLYNKDSTYYWQAVIITVNAEVRG